MKFLSAYFRVLSGVWWSALLWVQYAWSLTSPIWSLGVVRRIPGRQSLPRFITCTLLWFFSGSLLSLSSSSACLRSQWRKEMWVDKGRRFKGALSWKLTNVLKSLICNHWRCTVWSCQDEWKKTILPLIEKTYQGQQGAALQLLLQSFDFTCNKCGRDCCISRTSEPVQM